MRIILFILLWAFISILMAESTIVDSLYAIPEMDGDITANQSGLPININTTDYEFFVGDLGIPYENWSIRAFISFPLPTIPNGYSLINATIRLYQNTSLGFEQLDDSTMVNTYFPHWDVAGGDTVKCIVSHLNYGDILDLSDWEKGDEGNAFTYNHNVGEITRAGMNEPGNEPGHHGEAGYRYLDITDCVLQDLASDNIFSQYRISFQINTDYDGGADFVKFLSANSNPDYPEFLPILYFTLTNPDAVDDETTPCLSNSLHVYPNPVRADMLIDFDLKMQSDISLKLFDIKGRLVDTISQNNYRTGKHTISYHNSELKSGIYLLSISTGKYKITKKITCLK